MAVVSRIKTWEELTIQDNFLFQKVMQNKRICKHLIERILDIKIQEITFPDAEKSIDIRYDSKGIRLDVYVKDETGCVFDIEMQCTNGVDDELAKRTRYYQGMIDMEILEKGELYNKLNPTFIIFICTFDPFQEGLPMYTFRNRCVEKEGLELGDQTTKLFLNSKGRSETLDPDIAAFLRYVDGNAPHGEFAKELDQEVLRVKKHDETRREYMTLAMELRKFKEEGIAQGIEQGIEQGSEKKEQFIIMNMVGMHMPVDSIAQMVGQTPQYVQHVIDRVQASQTTNQ